MITRGTLASYSQKDFWKSKPSNIDYGAKRLPEHYIHSTTSSKLELCQPVDGPAEALID